MKRSVVHGILLVLALILASCASPSPQAVPSAPAPTNVPTLLPSPTAGPRLWLSRRGYHAAAYDSHCDRVVIYGGETQETDVSAMLTDTWTYDVAANTWEAVSPSQTPPMSEGPMVYDAAAERVILFVGNATGVESQPYGIDSASQTWAYDCGSNAWTNLNSKGTPSGLLGARMVYDAKADRVILFSGMNVPIPKYVSWTFSDETWAYDYHTNTWTNLHPKVSPPGQNYFSMVYDTTTDQVLAWIKPDSDGDNTLWAYDYGQNTWIAHPMDKPEFRYYNSGAYVPTVKKSFFFGGATVDNETALNDFWTYDPAANTWAEVSTSSGPGPRGWTTLSYSDKADKLVLIGGGTDRSHFTSEVWIYDLKQGTWTQAGQ